jgi:predicted DNA binding CopG/RHH family protein
LEPPNGAKVENSMKNITPDPAEPIVDLTIVKDFLPSPEQLVPRKTTVRVTMEFTQESIEFFKREAKNHNASYQAMIRNLVDTYAKQQQQ